jgi:hypothetical protein
MFSLREGVENDNVNKQISILNSLTHVISEIVFRVHLETDTTKLYINL